MSHFYSQINQSARKTQVSARGHKTTGLETVCAGWKGCIRTRVWFDEETGRDMFEVTKEPWQGSGGKPEVISRGVLDATQGAFDLPRGES